MKRKFSLLLILLPVLFLIAFLWCRSSKGDYYLINRYDPSYAYLMNSLNLAQLDGDGVGHYDHPGTTVQEAGALTINILYLISDKKTDLVTDVFERSEYYLSGINMVFILMNSIGLFVLGLITYRRTGSIYSALFLQLTPLFSMTIFFWIINVSPEPLLIFTLLILLSLCICFVTEDTFTKKKEILYTVGFAVICGFGLASKISVLPVLIIPVLLIRGVSLKFIFCFLTIVVFALFVLPAVNAESPYKFFLFYKNLLTHTGKYGLGEPKVLDYAAFKTNLRAIFSKERIFALSYLIISVTLLITLIPSNFRKIKTNKFYKLFFGIFIAITIQIVIVAKHYELHYLIPAFMLVAAGLYISDVILNELFPGKLKFKSISVICVLIFIFSFVQVRDLVKSNNYFAYRRDISLKYVDYKNSNYKDWMTMSSYGASDRQFALFFGASYAGSQKEKYFSMLRRLYPNDYYYNKWLKKIEPVEDLNILKDNLLKADKMIFLCDNEGFIKEFEKIFKEFTGLQDVTYKKVYSGFGDETIFEMYLTATSTESQQPLITH